MSCLSSAWAIATLVPTPSAEVASSGRSYGLERAGVEEPGEAADAADHLGAAGLVDPHLHQLDGLVAGLDGDPGRFVRRAGAVARGLLLGHRGSCGLRVRDARGRRPRRRRPARPTGRRRRARSGIELQQVLAEVLRLGQLDRVDAVEAGPAQVRPSAPSVASTSSLERDVAERVGVDGAADLVGGQPVGDQLGAGGEVDAVEARPLHRRRRRSARAPRGRRPRAASGPGRAGCCRARSSRRRRPAACPRSRRAAG